MSENKVIGGPINKHFLTPCRRIGLGKSHSGSMKKSPLENSINSINLLVSCEDKVNVTNECQTPKSGCVSKLKGRSKTYKNSKYGNIKQSLITSKNILNDGELADNNIQENNIVCKDIELSSEHKFVTNNLEVTNEILTGLALQIRTKQEAMKDCGIQETPNDLITLQKTVDNWCKAAQNALQYLLNINKERGICISLAELINIHGFDAEILRFVPEEDDFI